MQFNVEESIYMKVANTIKNAYKLERVKTVYVIKLVLENYLNYLNSLESLEKGNEDCSSSQLTQAENMILTGRLDTVAFKNAYELSMERDKEKLLFLVRTYLEEYNIELNKKIRAQVNENIKRYSSYYSPENFIPKKRSDFGSCNVKYISKVYTDLLLVIQEVENYKISDIIQEMEAYMKMKKGKQVVVN